MAKSKSSERSYKTGDACKELDVQPYVLRYWETEFPMVSGKKAGSQKIYSEQDLSVLGRIKELLYDEGYTIAGAKKRIEAELDGEQPSAAPSTRSSPKSRKKKPRPAKAKGSAAESSKEVAGEEPVADDASLDTVSRQSIESVLPELRKLHREAVSILELVRG